VICTVPGFYGPCTFFKIVMSKSHPKFAHMRAAVPIPAVASASVVHSAAVGGSVVGVVRPL